ncbi:unnamed protein product [Caenorhabditis auriculariae]|uniref:Uncharacterized protein n=1 Tax=Caenorhabditis auriculariae TaxID=2777116 RepID=A0A8S1GUT7_9PELO|nr:unnamed protein product [Caenorhabditis auriculariae]
MNVLLVLALLASVMVFACHAYTLDYGVYPYAQPGALRRAELESIMKRFMPQKERRGLEGFEDMPGLLRSLDGIQKPRFG